MHEPVKNLMHNGTQLGIAELQDVVVQAIFNSTNAVMHGGTAIWRCYGGRRFSEGIDLYMDKRTHLYKLVNRLAQAGLHTKFNRERKGTVYYDIAEGDSKVSLQIKLVKKKGALVPYERTNGTLSEIYSLGSEELLREKIDAYTDRLLIRDAYDKKRMKGYLKKCKGGVNLAYSNLSHRILHGHQ